VVFHEPPDLVIATDELTPDEVYGVVSRAIGGGTA
jgi:hypothetical protein